MKRINRIRTMTTEEMAKAIIDYNLFPVRYCKDDCGGNGEECPQMIGGNEWHNS